MISINPSSEIKEKIQYLVMNLIMAITFINAFQIFYYKYPFYKEYLFINYDDFMKSWELENLDFDTPWIYELGPMRKD